MDLTIAKGKKVVLSASSEGLAQKAIVALRPKTTRGLKRLMGLIDPHGLIDLNKSKDLAIGGIAKGSVKLLADDRGLIGGIDFQVLKNAVNAVGDDDDLPKLVLVKNTSVATGMKNGIAQTSRYAAAGVAIPQWLRELKVYIPGFVFGDIRLEAGATLEIAGDFVELFARSLYVHRDARIVYTANHVRLQVSGTSSFGMT